VGVEEELMKCRFMKRDGKNLGLLSFHFEKKMEGLADVSNYIVERENNFFFLTFHESCIK